MTHECVCPSVPSLRMFRFTSSRPKHQNVHILRIRVWLLSRSCMFCCVVLCRPTISSQTWLSLATLVHFHSGCHKVNVSYDIHVSYDDVLIFYRQAYKSRGILWGQHFHQFWISYNHLFNSFEVFRADDHLWGGHDLTTARQVMRSKTKTSLVYSILTRDARYWYSKSVCLSVRYVPVPDENGLTYS